MHSLVPTSVFPHVHHHLPAPLASLPSPLPRSLFLISFHPFPTPSLRSRTSPSQVSSLQALADQYHSNPIRFLWVDASSHGAIAAAMMPVRQLSLLPAIIVVNAERGRFVVHSDGLASLPALLDKALSNELQFKEALPENWGQTAVAEV